MPGTLRETAKLNGIKDTVKWLDRFHRAFFEHCERMTLTARYESRRPGKGDGIGLRIQRITAEMIGSFDFKPWLAWNYVTELPADEKNSSEPPVPSGPDAHAHPGSKRLSAERGVRLKSYAPFC